MYQNSLVKVIIAAAGSGKRMESGISKQYIKIEGGMILEKALLAFSEHPFVDEIYLVVKIEDLDFCYEEFVEKNKIHKIRAIISGGDNRQASVYNGLKTIIKGRESSSGLIGKKTGEDLVMIHDGARPFVSKEEISDLVKAAAKWGAASLGVPVKDSIARVEGMWINENLDRSKLYSIHTPQGFRFSLIFDAHKKAKNEGFLGTDDAGLVNRLDKKVVMVPGSYTNIKITTKEDLASAGGPETRIGTGFDVHGFAPNTDLILGGVKIPWDRGLAGHSDADVLTHAIMDALLGACGLGDIGVHFPDTDAKFKDISSILLLRDVVRAIEEEGYVIGNIDAVVIAQKPKISPYIKEMKEIISAALKIEVSRVNIKGTTTERLGFCGREEGIAAMASAIITKQ